MIHHHTIITAQVIEKLWNYCTLVSSLLIIIGDPCPLGSNWRANSGRKIVSRTSCFSTICKSSVALWYNAVIIHWISQATNICPPGNRPLRDRRGFCRDITTLQTIIERFAVLEITVEEDLVQFFMEFDIQLAVSASQLRKRECKATSSLQGDMESRTNGNSEASKFCNPEAVYQLQIRGLSGEPAN